MLDVILNGQADAIIRSLSGRGAQPICLLVGLLLKEPDKAPRESARYGVRLVPPVLDALGLAYDTVDTDAQADAVAARFDEAYRRSRPHAILLGRPPTS